MPITRSQVLAALKRVKGPDLQSNVVDLGMVSEPIIADQKVTVSVAINPARAQELEPMRQACEAVLLQLPEVSRATVVLTSNREPGAAPQRPAPPEHPKVAQARQQNGEGVAPQSAAAQRPAPERGRTATGIPGVKHMIAVASGKGGVGKSTTAVNLALALLAQGQKVGLLDADIYGPSQPRLLGISGRPKPAPGGSRLKPMEAFGLKVMSMGFMVDEATPIIWRGPMVASALNQMMREVDWGELDMMVVDMPPGTGDVQLTMAQQVPLAGAVIVSTPQDLALIDARKGLAMFQKVNVPVLGIIENMSYFHCPSCGERSDIFGTGGAEKEAQKLKIPFLGAIPLHMDIRSKSDLGQPIVASVPDGPHAEVFRDIAARVLGELGRASKSANTVPDLQVNAARDTLQVSFDDGRAYTLAAELLRVLSPSAEVQGHSPDQRVTVGGKRNVRIRDLRPVGNYAVRIVFDDGHDTGLFTWTYLATLGEEKDKRWAEYLSELEQKGLSRD